MVCIFQTRRYEDCEQFFCGYQSNCKRITIYGYALTYALQNPRLNYYLEGFDEETTSVSKHEMQPVSCRKACESKGILREGMVLVYGICCFCASYFVYCTRLDPGQDEKTAKEAGRE